MIQAPGTISCVAAQSPVNPKPCGTFSWPTSKSPFSPFSSRQSLSCCLSRVANRSTPKPRGPLYSPSEPRGVLPFPSEPRGSLSIYLLQNLVVLPFTSEPRGLLPIYFGAAWSPLSFPKTFWSSLLLWSRVVSSFSPKTLWSSLLLWSRVVSSHLLQSHVVSSFYGCRA